MKIALHLNRSVSAILFTLLFGLASSFAQEADSTLQHYIENQPPNLPGKPMGKFSDMSEDHDDMANRAKGALLGLAIGDALGLALKAAPRPEHVNEVVAEMTGNSNLHGGLLPGEWTGSTSMALALAESVLNLVYPMEDDILYKWNLWKTEGYLNVKNFRVDRVGSERHEPAFDVDSTTQLALDYFLERDRELTIYFNEFRAQPLFQHSPPKTVITFKEPFPGTDLHNRGLSRPTNDPLRRVAPISIFYHLSDIYSPRAIRMQAQLTHAHPASVDAAAVFGHMLYLALHGASKEAVLAAKWFKIDSFSADPESQKIRALFLPQAAWRHKTRAELVPPANDPMGKSAEFTLECALWAISKSDNFRDALLIAINLGGDADAVGSVTGQLAGSLYGMNEIPLEWRNQVVLGADMERLAQGLVNKGYNFFDARASRHMGVEQDPQLPHPRSVFSLDGLRHIHERSNLLNGLG